MPIDIAAAVIANRPLAAGYHVLSLAAPEIAAAAEPGQFVMVKASNGFDPLLRRPFSIFDVLRDRSGAPTGISILSKRVGRSTSLLYGATENHVVSCLGPLGRPWPVIDPPAQAWLVAGGVGLAAFPLLAAALIARGVTTTLFYGARTAGELLCLDRFEALGARLMLTTEDGSAGEPGRITVPLQRALEQPRAGASPVVYACGPEPMMAAVARFAVSHAAPCHVSMERIMGCGLGGCFSCVVPMRSDDGAVHHVRSCIAGPVLPGDRVVWE